jgi:hypothetical protein
MEDCIMKKFLALFSFLFFVSGQACAMRRTLAILEEVTDSDARASLSNGSSRALVCENNQWDEESKEDEGDPCEQAVGPCEEPIGPGNEEDDFASYAHQIDVRARQAWEETYAPYLEREKDKVLKEEMVALLESTGVVIEDAQRLLELQRQCAEAIEGQKKAVEDWLQWRSELEEGINNGTSYSPELLYQEKANAHQAHERTTYGIGLYTNRLECKRDMEALLQEAFLVADKLQDLLDFQSEWVGDQGVEDLKKQLAHLELYAQFLEERIKEGVQYSPEMLSQEREKMRKYYDVTMMNIVRLMASLDSN